MVIEFSKFLYSKSKFVLWERGFFTTIFIPWGRGWRWGEIAAYIKIVLPSPNKIMVPLDQIFSART